MVARVTPPPLPRRERGFAGRSHGPLPRMKINRLILLVFAGLCWTGCGKHDATPPPVRPAAQVSAASENPLNAPADYGTALANAQKSATKTVDLASLAKAIELFQVNEGRLPKTLDELVAGKYISQIPPAPAGLRIVYDPATGAVKTVRQ